MSLRAAFLALGLVAWAAPGLAGNGAAPACSDRAPDPITAPTAAGEKCQQAIAKEGAKFLKSKTSTLSKCLLKSAPGTCPAAADTAKIEQAALEGHGEDREGVRRRRRRRPASRASYNDLTDDAAISSCMLSQHNAIAQTPRPERDRHLDRGLAGAGHRQQGAREVRLAGRQDRRRHRPRHPGGARTSASPADQGRDRRRPRADLRRVHRLGRRRPAERREDRGQGREDPRVRGVEHRRRSAARARAAGCPGLRLRRSRDGRRALRVPPVPGLPERRLLRRAAVRRDAARLRRARTGRASRPRWTPPRRARSS